MPIAVRTQTNRSVRRRFLEAQQQQRRETWRAVQAVSRRRRQSAWLALQSAHQRRATQILGVFDAEVRNVTTSPLATFLLHYICCEALGKLLIGSRDNIPPYKILQYRGTKIGLKKLKPAIHRLGSPVSDTVLETIFLRDRETAGERSCRALRNAILHELQSDHLAEVNRRITELTKDMKDFIEGIRVQSGAGHVF
jgi:hypothetical protein